MKKSLAFLVVFFSLVTGAWSTVTALIAKPQYPTIGNGFQVLTLNNNTPPVSSINWARRIDYPPNTGSMTQMAGSGAGTTDVANVPGYYNYFAAVTYSPFPPTPGNFVSTMAGVAAPNAMKCIAGLNTPTLPGFADVVQYQILCGGTVVGPMLAMAAQEQMLTYTVYNADGSSVTVNTPSGWFPTSQGTNWYLSQGVIYDSLLFADTPEWNDFPVGATLMVFTQQVQLVWGYVTDTGQIVYLTAQLGNNIRTYVKNSATTYTIQ